MRGPDPMECHLCGRIPIEAFSLEKRSKGDPEGMGIYRSFCYECVPKAKKNGWKEYR